MENKKKVIIQINDVRIKEYDSMNVVVERLENVMNPKTKETSQKWVFKGYSRNVLAALLMIQDKELLIDRSNLKSVDVLLKQNEETNKMLAEAAEKVYGKL